MSSFSDSRIIKAGVVAIVLMFCLGEIVYSLPGYVLRKPLEFGRDVEKRISPKSCDGGIKTAFKPPVYMDMKHRIYLCKKVISELNLHIRKDNRRMVCSYDSICPTVERYVERIEDGLSLPFDHVTFIRIEHLFLLEEESYLKLSEELKESLGSNAVIFKKFESGIDKEWLAHFDFAVIIAMINCDIKGKRVIDCGCGDGILGLIAMKLGAQFCDLIDINEPILNEAKENLRLNGFKENINYKVHRVDLKDPQGVKNAITSMPDDIETVIISNIGHWGASYDVTNFDTIDLIEHIPNVAVFVSGGYRDTIKGSDWSIKMLYSEKDREYIEGNYGFKVEDKRIVVTYKSSPDEECIFSAWIAKREVISGRQGLMFLQKSI